MWLYARDNVGDNDWMWSTKTNLSMKRRNWNKIGTTTRKSMWKCLFICKCSFFVYGVLNCILERCSLLVNNLHWQLSKHFYRPHDHLHTHNTLQTITIISICLERLLAADYKKKRVAPQWKMLTLFVWLPECRPVEVGVLIIQENSGDPPVIRSSGSLYSGGLLLPGQSFPDSSHGSEPLGHYGCCD